MINQNIMTNEEKASQIALEICGEPTEFDITGEYPCSEEAAMKMAEWKDKQFKEYLENTIKAYKCRGEAFFTAEIKALEDIINELFKED